MLRSSRITSKVVASPASISGTNQKSMWTEEGRLRRGGGGESERSRLKSIRKIGRRLVYWNLRTVKTIVRSKLKARCDAKVKSVKISKKYL